MTPDEARKIDALLNLNIPKDIRVCRAHHDWVEYMDPNHIIGVRIRWRGSKEPFYAFADADDIKNVDVTRIIGNILKSGSKTRVCRKYLLEVLKNLDSEYVEIINEELSPLLIRGTVGNDQRYANIIIAPMVNQGYDEDDENINPDEPKEEDNDG